MAGLLEGVGAGLVGGDGVDAEDGGAEDDDGHERERAEDGEADAHRPGAEVAEGDVERGEGHDEEGEEHPGAGAREGRGQAAEDGAEDVDERMEEGVVAVLVGPEGEADAQEHHGGEPAGGVVGVAEGGEDVGEAALAVEAGRRIHAPIEEVADEGELDDAGEGEHGGHDADVAHQGTLGALEQGVAHGDEGDEDGREPIQHVARLGGDEAPREPLPGLRAEDGDGEEALGAIGRGEVLEEGADGLVGREALKRGLRAGRHIGGDLGADLAERLLGDERGRDGAWHLPGPRLGVPLHGDAGVEPLECQEGDERHGAPRERVAHDAAPDAPAGVEERFLAPLLGQDEGDLADEQGQPGRPGREPRGDDAAPQPRVQGQQRRDQRTRQVAFHASSRFGGQPMRRPLALSWAASSAKAGSISTGTPSGRVMPA